MTEFLVIVVIFRETMILFVMVLMLPFLKKPVCPLFQVTALRTDM